ncbi:MAG: hypothetical protein IT374_11980 [Polyangiaceae bacterium]|nr:hypothetical protein [Polyangiaceae bacterium]
MHEIAEGLLATTGDLRLGAGFWMPARATALSCGAGAVALVSPLPLADADVAAIESLGKVAWVVAPNRMHHMHVAAAAARFPEAKLALADGVADKLREPLASVPLASTPLGSEVTSFAIHGAPAMSEVAILHAPSRTLVVTDLVFNLRATRGFLTPLILTLVGARGRFAQSRAVRFMVKDRAALARSFDALLDAHFDRVVMAHGEIVERGGKDALAGALGWARASAAVPLLT